MYLRTAKQISLLLERNNLPNEVNPYRIMDSDYIYLEEKGVGEEKHSVIACAFPKRVSFFMYELKHLSVKEGYEGRGLGRLMVEMCEKFAISNDVYLIAATTNIHNDAANALFNKLNYHKVFTFHNTKTRHDCNLWQKILINKRDA